MTRIELIFDATCPHVDAARIELRAALAYAGRPLIWIEWEREAPDTPPYANVYASPTVLIDGRDVVAGGVLDGDKGCRVYAQPNGTFAGAPSAGTILAALTAAMHA